MKKSFTIALLCAGTALVAGCGKKTPAGQVAATVNGKDVTLQEINTELQAANVPPTADKQEVQRALLQQVIERKLLVQAAHDKGIDKTPEFLAQKRRAEELLLAQAYAKQQLTAIAVPTAAEIDKYMADHPNVFAAREQLQLDQIRFQRPPNPKALAVLQNDHSQDAVAATLTKLGIKFERGSAGLDTASVPTPVMAQINRLPATEPFVVPTQQFLTVNVITARKPVPLDPAKARPAATQAWRQGKFADLLKSQLDALKGSAKIQYQNGFGPPADPKAVPKPAIGGPATPAVPGAEPTAAPATAPTAG